MNFIINNFINNAGDVLEINKEISEVSVPTVFEGFFQLRRTVFFEGGAIRRGFLYGLFQQTG